MSIPNAPSTVMAVVRLVVQSREKIADDKSAWIIEAKGLSKTISHATLTVRDEWFADRVIEPGAEIQITLIME